MAYSLPCVSVEWQFLCLTHAPKPKYLLQNHISPPALPSSRPRWRFLELCIHLCNAHNEFPQNSIAFKQHLLYWVKTWVGTTIFLWPTKQGFGAWNPPTVLADRVTEPDIPSAILILPRSCVTSCRVATEVCSLSFFTVFYPYCFSILTLCSVVQFEETYWSQILTQMLTPNSAPEVATKTTSG